MYESPIEKIVGEIQSQIIKQDDENLMYKVKQAVGYSVDKNELIRALQYDRKQYEKGYRDGLNADKWIPVSERLPEEDGRYLVTVYDKIFGNTIGMLRYSHNLHELDEFDFPNEERAGWCTYDNEWGFVEYDNVIAWMPLPAPYKAESEELC